MFVNGVLIPIRYLVNGRTIRQEARDEVTYWHVELAEHNVLYAEGVPAESYLDTGNRSAFANGGAVMDLHADFARRVWETRSCAPLVLSGPKLAAAKRRLHDRVNAFGHRTTNDAGLKVLVNGREVFAKRKAGTLHVRLPGGTEHVRLISRVWIPAHMQARCGGRTYARDRDFACVAGRGRDRPGRSVLHPRLACAGAGLALDRWRWLDRNVGCARVGIRGDDERHLLVGTTGMRQGPGRLTAVGQPVLFTPSVPSDRLGSAPAVRRIANVQQLGSKAVVPYSVRP